MDKSIRKSELTRASREDLKTTEKGSLSPDVKNDELEKTRGEMKGRLDLVSQIQKQLAPEQEKTLERYKTDYNYMRADLKAQCSWEEVRSSLLANNGYYLRLAEGLNEKGIFFGIDKAGNLLFADGGAEAIMKNMSYDETRQAVRFKKKADKQVPTGYEMFPSAGNGVYINKSPEIEMFEVFTRRPFIVSSEWHKGESSWLECGEKPRLPDCAYFQPEQQTCLIERDKPSADYRRGVRRLLRVKKV